MAEVLLFEDEEDHALYTSKLLQDLNHDVVWAKEDSEVKQLLEKHDFKLIVLDIAKFDPDGTYDIEYGLRIAEMIRSHPKFTDTPLVFTTILNMKKTKAAAKRLGATAYFVKPIPASDFRRLVGEVLSK